MRLLALTCEVLARSVYLCAARSRHVVDVRLNRRGLHDDPPNLRAILQAEIDEISAPYDAVVLAYGLCGGATAGLRCGAIPLVVPRAHDCITLFLGDRARYQAEFSANPGTYWYVQDYLERTDDGSAFGGVGAVSDASALETYREYVATTPIAAVGGSRSSPASCSWSVASSTARGTPRTTWSCSRASAWGCRTTRA